MILDIDIGNTRIKWRLYDPISGRSSLGNCVVLEDLLSELVRLEVRPERVRVSCVGRATTLDMLDRWLQQHGLAACQRAKTTAALGGVTNGYREPGQLGVDRWLAACAAFRLARGACVVVDAGSAVTLDVVDAAGLHRGGYIVPGLRLQQAALRVGTENVVFSADTELGNVDLGACTQAAVHHGILFMLTGFMEKASRDYAASSCDLILTGGDAALLAANLAVPHRVVPDLVFQGIEIALP